MPRRGDNIYKRKDGRWEGRYVKGRKHGKTTFGYVFAATLTAARKKLADAKQLWKTGCETREKKNETLGAVSEQWLEDSKSFLKESTIAKYRDYLSCYILPRFGDISLGDLSTEAVAAFFRILLKEGGASCNGLSTRTVAEVRCILKIIQKYAVKQGCIVNFSLDNIVMKQKEKPIRIFSEQEQERLRSYLCATLTPCHAGILLCLSTGIRLGELCALRWDDISLSSKQLHVRRTMQRIRETADAQTRTKIVITSPKSDCSIRTIPLSDNMCSSLRPFYRSGTFLLTGDHERFVEPRTMQNWFKGVLGECGIADANFHALRHTFATRCVEAGFDAKCLSVILGHSNVNITFNRYVHPTMEMKRRNMEKLQ